MKTIETLLERTILFSRWLLVPIYLALAAALVLFTVKAFQEVVHLFAIITTASEVDLALAVLALIDMAGLESLSNFDIGGVRLNFGKTVREGNSYTDTVTIDGSGRLIS